MALPCLYAAIFYAPQSKSWVHLSAYALLGVFGLTAALFAGFTQMLAYGLIVVGFFALVQDFLDWQHTRRIAPIRIAMLAAVVLVSVAVALPQLFAVAELVPYSVRTAHYTAGENRLLFTDFFSLVLPYYVRIPYVVNGMPGIYFGLLSLVFFCIVFVRERSRYALFFAIAYVCMFALALDTPLTNLINNSIPVLSRFGTVSRWLLAGALPFGIAAAYGYDAFVHTLRRSRARFVFAICALLPALFFVATAGATAYVLRDVSLRHSILSFVLSHAHKSQSAAFYDTVLLVYLRNMQVVFSFASMSLWAFIAASIGLFIFLTRTLSIRSTSIVAVSLTLVFALQTLWTENAGAFSPRSEILTPPSSARAITSRESDLNSFRFVTLLASPGFFQDVGSQRRISPQEGTNFNVSYLEGESGTFFGLATIAGFEPIRSLRQNQLIDTVLAPDSFNIFDPRALGSGATLSAHFNTEAVRKGTAQEKIDAIYSQLPLFSMMNVKYFVSYYPLQNPHLKTVAYQRELQDPYIYENTDVLPRAYFARSVEFDTGSNEEVLAKILAEKNFALRTHIECATCVRNNATASSSIDAYEPGEIHIQVHGGGGWLVLSESDLPGWVVTIDGTVSPIYTANYLFQSVQVPAGDHSVIFRYVPSLSSPWGHILQSL
jgi:hypothetical protein